MENEFLAVLSTCPWALNARLLKKPEQPETVQTVLNDMITFNLKEGCEVSELKPLITGYLDRLGFSDTQRPVRFESQSEGVNALFAAIYTDGNLSVRIAVSWLEQENRLAVIHITQLG